MFYMNQCSCWKIFYYTVANTPEIDVKVSVCQPPDSKCWTARCVSCSSALLRKAFSRGNHF